VFSKSHGIKNVNADFIPAIFKAAPHRELMRDLRSAADDSWKRKVWGDDEAYFPFSVYMDCWPYLPSRHLGSERELGRGTERGTQLAFGTKMAAR